MLTCILFSAFASPTGRSKISQRLNQIINQHHDSVKDALREVQHLLCKFPATSPQSYSIPKLIEDLYTLHAGIHGNVVLEVAQAILKNAPRPIAGQVFLHSSLEVVSWLQGGTSPVSRSPVGPRAQVQRQRGQDESHEGGAQRGTKKKEASPTLRSENNPRAGKLRETPSRGPNSPLRRPPTDCRRHSDFASSADHVIEPPVVILSDDECKGVSDDIVRVSSEELAQAWHATKVDIQLPTFNADTDVLPRFEAKAAAIMMEQVNQLPDEAVIRLCPLPTLDKHDRSIPSSSMRRLLNMEESAAAFLDDCVINEYIESLTSMDKASLSLIPSTNSELQFTRSFEPGILYFWPIHSDLHWSLLTIKAPANPEDRLEVVHYDSLHRGHMARLGELLDLINSRGGACRKPCEIRRVVKEQRNGTDCGVFVCLQARSLAREAARNSPRRSFAEPYEKERSRKRIALELLVPLFNEDPVPKTIDLDEDRGLDIIDLT